MLKSQGIKIIIVPSRKLWCSVGRWAPVWHLVVDHQELKDIIRVTWEKIKRATCPLGDAVELTMQSLSSLFSLRPACQININDKLVTSSTCPLNCKNWYEYYYFIIAIILTGCTISMCKNALGGSVWATEDKWTFTVHGWLKLRVSCSVPHFTEPTASFWNNCIMIMWLKCILWLSTDLFKSFSSKTELIHIYTLYKTIRSKSINPDQSIPVKSLETVHIDVCPSSTSVSLSIYWFILGYEWTFSVITNINCI